MISGRDNVRDIIFFSKASSSMPSKVRYLSREYLFPKKIKKQCQRKVVIFRCNRFCIFCRTVNFPQCTIRYHPGIMACELYHCISHPQRLYLELASNSTLDMKFQNIITLLCHFMPWLHLCKIGEAVVLKVISQYMIWH